MLIFLYVVFSIFNKLIKFKYNMFERALKRSEKIIFVRHKENNSFTVKDRKFIYNHKQTFKNCFVFHKWFTSHLLVNCLCGLISDVKDHPYKWMFLDYKSFSWIWNLKDSLWVIDHNFRLTNKSLHIHISKSISNKS